MLALVAVRSVLVLLLVAGFLAIGTGPGRAVLGRHGLRRTYAVGVVLRGAWLQLSTAYSGSAGSWSAPSSAA